MALHTKLHDPRVLPFIVLADTSGSMSEHGKIETLNLSMEELLFSLAKVNEPDVQIMVAVISFGGGSATLHHPLTAAGALEWRELTVGGDTPMGAAFDELIRLTDDRILLPDNSYLPLILLISDGLPTDSFEENVARFEKSSVGKRSIRLAIQIGPDADSGPLRRFTGAQEMVLYASQAADIDQHIRFAASLVTSRARSSTQGNADNLMTSRLGLPDG